MYIFIDQLTYGFTDSDYLVGIFKLFLIHILIVIYTDICNPNISRHLCLSIQASACINNVHS